jgi:signal transduction histidine kinase
MTHRQQHHPDTVRRSAPAGMEVPRQRAGNHEPPVEDDPEEATSRPENGAREASPRLPKMEEYRLLPRPRLVNQATPRWVTRFLENQRAKNIASDVAAVVLAMLDVWLVIPEDAPAESLPLSGAAVAAMVMRRQVPFLAVLVTVPGFLTGWSQLAAMIALGTLAKRRGWGWQLVVAAFLVWCCRFITWPLPEFVSTPWREHVLNGIYGVLVVSMPIAIGLLITARRELSAHIIDLANSREREKALYAETVRAAERTKLAREMHDVVSHQVTLIAMQAGALQVAASDENSRETATTIRRLSTRTLEELRSLVGLLRSGVGGEGQQPGLARLTDLGSNFRSDAVPVALDVEAEPSRLPRSVSHAVYRTVQEALTNVRKHAAGARASVKVRAQQDTLVVEVRNGRAGGRPPALPSGGHGLIGLRERAGLLGGTFQAGPTSEGGFRVSATYPLAG